MWRWASPTPPPRSAVGRPRRATKRATPDRRTTVANVVIREKVRRALEIRRDLHRHGARAVQRAARERDRLVLGVGSYAGAPDIAVSRGDPDHRVVVGNYSSIA